MAFGVGFLPGRFFYSTLFYCFLLPLGFPFVHLLCTPWNIGSFLLNTLLFIDKNNNNNNNNDNNNNNNAIKAIGLPSSCAKDKKNQHDEMVYCINFKTSK